MKEDAPVGKEKLILTPAERKMLLFDRIPPRHIEAIWQHFERICFPMAFSIYAENKFPRDVLLKSATRYCMNNFLINFGPPGEKRMVRPEIKRIILNALQETGIDPEKWHQEQDQIKDPTATIHKRFELWPAFVKALEHVDDPHELWG